MSKNVETTGDLVQGIVIIGFLIAVCYHFGWF